MCSSLLMCICTHKTNVTFFQKVFMILRSWPCLIGDCCIPNSITSPCFSEHSQWHSLWYHPTTSISLVFMECSVQKGKGKLDFYKEELKSLSQLLNLAVHTSSAAIECGLEIWAEKMLWEPGQATGQDLKAQQMSPCSLV